MCGNEVAHERETFDGDVPDTPGIALADETRELGVTGSDAEERLCAAAPRTAPPDALPFQQHHAIATLCEVKRGRAPRDAAAHDTNIAVGCAVQRGPGRRAVCRGGVIRVSGFHGEGV